MKISKTYEPHDEHPFGIEVLNPEENDEGEPTGFAEVVDCFWYATEDERDEQFNAMLSEYCH